jgi:hypothetical protein
MAGAQRIPTTGPTDARSRSRDWWLERDEHGVTARDRSGPIAHVEVREDGDRVQLDFSTEERLPHGLHARLTSLAFEHPSLRPQRLVSAAFPVREADILIEIRSHLAGASTRAAGTTCLLDGRVT